jgi:hypothetical protein
MFVEAAMTTETNLAFAVPIRAVVETKSISDVLVLKKEEMEFIISVKNKSL